METEPEGRDLGQDAVDKAAAASAAQNTAACAEAAHEASRVAAEGMNAAFVAAAKIARIHCSSSSSSSSANPSYDLNKPSFTNTRPS